MELRFAHCDEAAATMAEMVMRMLGAFMDDAQEVARRPFPSLG
ncbi:hypothetical protein [Streptomyces sp. NBC_00996]